MQLSEKLRIVLEFQSIFALSDKPYRGLQQVNGSCDL
jgi:hypothetical protein